MNKIKTLLIASLFCGVGVNAQEYITIRGSVGDLKAVIQKPENVKGKCPMTVIMHGFTGNKDEALLTGLADSLQRRGIASIRFDFNGHGESEGEFKNMTVLNEIEDAKAVIRYVQSLPWVGKLALAGHSQGGVVASMTAGELGNRQVKAVVLYAPAAVLRDDAIRGNLFGSKFNANNIPETVSVWGHTLGRSYFESAMTLPIYETACLYKGKTCVIHGDKDRVVPYTYGKCYAREYKYCEWHLINGGDHTFNRHRDEVDRLGADFIMKVLK